MARVFTRQCGLLTIFLYMFITFVFHIIQLSISFVDTNETMVRRENPLKNMPNYNKNKSDPIQIRASHLENITTHGLFVNYTFEKFNRSRPIVFLHIGKNGGTSLDRVMSPIIRGLHGKYVGFKHFDWSYIETIPNADVVVLLREPVARSVSHYYFMRKWSRGELNPGPMTSYLKSPQKMLGTRDCWQDGQAAISWLTGTHVSSWVGIKPEQVPARELQSLNVTEMCLLAAKRLESAFWFGIIEYIDRSLELLQHQLGRTEKIRFTKSNMNSHADASENDSLIIESLIPQDMWLYEYGKRLFEARWTLYKTGVYKHPDMPPVPSLETVPCISTQTTILCKKGPLSPLHYSIANASETKLPDLVLKRFDPGNILISNNNSTG